MDLQFIIAILSSGAVGGGLGAFFTFLSNRAKTKVAADEAEFSHTEYFIQQLKEENERLRAKELSLEQEFSALRDELVVLKNKVAMLESSNNELPVPVWLKDVTGIMLAVNDAYESTFLLPKGLKSEDYVGHRDEDIWGSETARQFRKHDREVFETGRTWKGVEYIPDGNGGSVCLYVVKWPRYVGDLKIGIGGLCVVITDQHTLEKQ